MNLDAAVVIAPKCLHDFYLGIRNQNPLLDFKLLTLEEVENLTRASYDSRAVIELLVRGLTFRLAKETLQAVCAMESGGSYRSGKLREIKEYRDLLDSKKLLIRERFPERTFLNRRVIVAGYPKGSPRLQKAIASLHQGDVFYEEEACPKKEGYPPVLSFRDTHAELHYVFNRIARLIDEGVARESIYLSGYQASARNEWEAFARMYGFSIDFPSSRTLRETGLGMDFLNLVRQENPIEHTGTESLETCLKVLREKHPEDPNLDDLCVAMERYAIPELPKEKQIVLWEDVLSSMKEKSARLDHAVQILRGRFAPNGSHVFHLGFCLGKDPVIASDNGFLSDEEKKELGMSTSKEKNAEDRENLIGFLHSSSLETLSFPRRNLDAEMHPSPLIAQEGIQVVVDPVLDYEYGTSFLPFWLVHELDQKRNYGKSLPELSFLVENVRETPRYDNRFTGVDPLGEGTRAYSFSSVDAYAKCPFRYYAGHILKIEDGGDSFASKLGQICHSLMERVECPDFDFDAEWASSIRRYLSKAENEPFTSEEKLLLDGLKDRLRKSVSNFQAFLRGTERLRCLSEQNYEIPLSEQVKLIGRVDKLLFTESEKGPQTTILDFKTSMNVEHDDSLVTFGLSLQLPVYAAIAMKDPNLSDRHLLGAFIVPILLDKQPKKAYPSEEEFYRKSLPLKGRFVLSDPELLSLDPCEGKSNYIKGLKRKGGVLTPDKKAKEPISEEEMKALADAAVTKTLEFDEKIRSGSFEIAPRSKDDDGTSCEYCPYRDLCYVRDYQRVVLKSDDDEDDEEEE